MQASVYPDDLKIENALQMYFQKYHFADGGYHDKYFRIKIGPVFIPFPNTKSRIKAVKFHDIHHLLSEYSARWKGEVEIGAWEIASGCGNLLIAWFLNFGSFGLGMFLYPKAVFNAFMMGRHVKSNLYHNYIYDDFLLKRNLGELRKELGIGEVRKNNLMDYLYFTGCLLLVITGLTLIIFLFYFVICK